MATTVAPPTTRTVVTGKRKGSAPEGKRGNRLLIWVFLAPTLIGLGLFAFIPIIGSVILAFFR